jgi:hypothetical protein
MLFGAFKQAQVLSAAVIVICAAAYVYLGRREARRGGPPLWPPFGPRS